MAIADSEGRIEPTPITVIVADNNKDVLIALPIRLSGIEGIRIIAQVGIKAQIIPQVAQRRPDVLLLDLSWGAYFSEDKSGLALDLIPELRELFHNLKIVALSNFPALRTEAIERGAHAALDKHYQTEELVGTIRAVCGQTFDTAGVGQSDESRLSSREVEVLRLVASGLTDSQIATRLFITANTVSTHVARIMQKLGASNRAHAVSIAHRDNLFKEK